MDQSFPYKRKNFIKRIYRFEKFMLYDEGFDFKGRYLKDEHSDITTIQSNTILRVVDPTSHICTNAQFSSDTCIPYLQLDIESTSKISTNVRVHPTFIQTAGETGGTVEIIVYILGWFYMFLFLKRNIREQNRNIWDLTDEEKSTYKTLTNHVINDEEIAETRE
jgi:cbb3-type cytochrome oxidase subunit 3